MTYNNETKLEDSVGDINIHHKKTSSILKYEQNLAKKDKSKKKT
jgi:hypothetical protein